MQRYFIKREFWAVDVSSSINFTSPSPFTYIAGGPSVTIPDMWTMAKENCFNMFFIASYKSLDLVVSFNGTKEAIASVTLY